MRVNISNNNVISIDFDTVDQVIDFIKKFNSSNSITNGINPIQTNPDDWKQPYNPYKQWDSISVNNPLITYERKHDLDTYKVADPVPNPYTITTNIK